MSKKKETQTKKGRRESVSIWIVEFIVIGHAHTQVYKRLIGNLMEAKCDFFSLFCFALPEKLSLRLGWRRVRPCIMFTAKYSYICTFIICSIWHNYYIFVCYYNAAVFLCCNHFCKTVKKIKHKVTLFAGIIAHTIFFSFLCRASFNTA